MTRPELHETFVRREINLRQTGQRIRELRTERGLSVVCLGDLVGASDRAVYHWEEGRSLPDIGKVPSICDVFGKTFEDVFICDP